MEAYTRFLKTGESDDLRANQGEKKAFIVDIMGTSYYLDEEQLERLLSKKRGSAIILPANGSDTVLHRKLRRFTDK